MQTNKFNDQEFDISFILNLMPGYVYWKDLDSIYRGCNMNLAIISNLSSPLDIIGKTDYDFNFGGYSATDFIKEDKFVMDTGETHISEQEILINNEMRTFRTEKTPLFSKSKQIIGVLGVAIDITAEKLATKLTMEIIKFQTERKAQEKFIKFIDTISNSIQQYKMETINEKLGISSKNTNQISKIILSKREEQIVYFLSLGKSPKETARVLSKIENRTISDATISSIINKQLYPKFDVANCGQLIEKATCLGLINFVPKSLTVKFDKK